MDILHRPSMSINRPAKFCAKNLDACSRPIPSLPHLTGEWETPAFWSHLPLTRHITKIFCISSTKFGQLILSKMVKIVATRCHYINAKMHQIRFRLGLRLRPWPRWRSHHVQYQVQYSPDILAGFKGILLLRGGKGREDGLRRGGITEAI